MGTFIFRGTTVALALVALVAAAEPQDLVPGLPPLLDPALSRGVLRGA